MCLLEVTVTIMSIFDRSGKKLNSWRLLGNNVHGLLVHGYNVIVSQNDPPKV